MTKQRERQRWKQEVAQILEPGQQWHPLDGVPAPEYVPPQWDGVHVGLRMIEGFKVLNRMPMGMRGGRLSGYWPEYWPDWSDLNSRKQGPDGQAIEVPPVRVRPSVNDITRMEQVIVWPARYIRHDGVRWMVQRVCFLRSRDIDIKRIAEYMRRPVAQVRQMNRIGLDQIAAGLRRDAVVVF